LGKAGEPCGPSNTLPHVFAEPRVIARGAGETMTRTDGASVRLTANPIRMSATPPTPRIAPPLLGEGTDATLKTILGLDGAAHRRLRESGVT
jgi:formyl-CoA transferase